MVQPQASKWSVSLLPCWSNPTGLPPACQTPNPSSQPLPAFDGVGHFRAGSIVARGPLRPSCVLLLSRCEQSCPPTAAPSCSPGWWWSPGRSHRPCTPGPCGSAGTVQAGHRRTLPLVIDQLIPLPGPSKSASSPHSIHLSSSWAHRQRSAPGAGPLLCSKCFPWH